MTINVADNTPRVSYSVAEGVTQTSFTVSFEFFNEADLNVYVDGTLKTLTTDYTVSGGNGSTGTVTISVTGATGGSTVVITRDIALERTTDFPASGAFQIGSLNTELDKLIAITADLDDKASRALQLTDYDTAVSLVLPDVDTRKGKTLAFNATSGAVEAGPTISDVQTVSAAAADIATLADIEDGTDATDAIQTVAGISSNVTTVAGISGNVTTVAGISSDVTAVAADATDIGTVATNIASVNTVATNINDVIAVANDLNEAISEVETVANDLNEAVSEIDTVATSITNVDTVGTNIANVNTVAGNNANVTTVAGISANVTTVAGISSNVTTVAGISSDVTTVAADSTDIGTVATNIANVNTVAGINSNVTTVAGISGNVTTVSGISSNVTTVAGVSSDVTTVAGQISPTNNVGTVAGIASDVSTVSGVSANVTTVAGNTTNINTVAGISGNVTTVAGISSDVTAVAADATDIGTVATNLAGTDTIGTVATNISNVNTVAGISSNVTTVAGISSDVTAVAADSTDIGTVATNIANVNTVGGSISNVNTVATNISSVNDFADKYRIGASDPTTNNDEGDLFYNTTTDTLKVYTGTAWEQGVTAGSGFLNLTGGTMTGTITFDSTQTFDGRDVSVDGAKLDGIEANATADQTAAEIRALVESATDSNVFTDADHSKLNGIESGATADQTASEILTLIKTVDGAGSGLDADTLDGVSSASFLRSDAADTKTSGNLIFNDNVQLQFGTSSDLEIYHNGTNSLISEVGTGDLIIYTNGAAFQVDSNTGENMIYAAKDAGVNLYHNNNVRIQSTNDGATITGNITVSGGGLTGLSEMTITGAGTLRDVTGQYGSIEVDGGATGGWEGYNIGGQVVFMTDGSAAGIYDDINNQWMYRGEFNGETSLRYQGSNRLQTTSGGVTVTGTVAATSFTGDGSSLTGIAAGATGGGSDEIFWENGQTVTSNYTITNGKNAMSAGPITINTGVTVTVGTGETWTVV